MLFVALLKTRPGSTFRQGGGDPPAGVGVPRGRERAGRVLAGDGLPGVVSVMKAESMAPFGAIRMHWGDLFGIEVFPAMSGEQGMEMLRQAMPQHG